MEKTNNKKKNSTDMKNNIKKAQRRLKKSQDNIKAARILIEQELYTDSLNRTYYAIFNVVSAVNVLNGFDNTKHSQTLGDFNKNMVKTGKFPKEYGRKCKEIFKKRQIADYDYSYQATYEDAWNTYNEALSILKKLSPYIDTAITNFESVIRK